MEEWVRDVVDLAVRVFKRWGGSVMVVDASIFVDLPDGHRIHLDVWEAPHPNDPGFEARVSWRTEPEMKRGEWDAHPEDPLSWFETDLVEDLHEALWG